jgi:hypothetical protein
LPVGAKRDPRFGPFPTASAVRSDDRRLSPRGACGTIRATVFFALRVPIVGRCGGQESAMTYLIGFGTYMALIALIYVFSDL